MKLVTAERRAENIKDVPMSIATIKGDKPQIIDGVGDVMVCLINYCALQDIDLVKCMEAAYAAIKDRKGTLLPNGVFVKEGA